MNLIDSVKIILVSQVPLPYSKVGSWTTLYHNYLQSPHLIDIIVCPEPENYYSTIKYGIVKEKITDKFKSKFLQQKKSHFLLAFNKCIITDDKYIVQLIDNYGMVKPLHDFLVAKGIRDNFYLQFFYHGFDPYTQIDSSENFYNILDELVYLTDASRTEFTRVISNLPKHNEVLHNGINTSKFTTASVDEVSKLKQQLSIESEKVFLWCSQDRPKKGLDLILMAWEKVYANNKNCILLVVGAHRSEQIPGVRFFGAIPNTQLPKYYQVADCYLFSTLCNEGFGMSLIEALHCGCYCIASKLGGVPEVLDSGKYGQLIENPTFTSEWIQAINSFLDDSNSFPKIPKTLYSMEDWNLKMNDIILNAKKRLAKKS